MLYSVGAGDCSGNFPFCGCCVQSFRKDVSGKILRHFQGHSWPQIFTRLVSCGLVLAQGVQGKDFPSLAFIRASCSTIQLEKGVSVRLSVYNWLSLVLILISALQSQCTPKFPTVYREGKWRSSERNEGCHLVTQPGRNRAVM